MNRISSLLLATVAIVVVAGYTNVPELPVPGSGGSTTPAAATTTLNAVVGPGTAISIKKGGKTFKTLKAGKYKIIVDDKVSNHNFRLKGPSLNKATTVSQVAKITWNVTLKKGKFTFVCDPHSGFMKGSFTVN